MSKPRVAISACLLGRPVRYNGEHKKQDWLVDHLSSFVTWVLLCPEVEMGLGVPRPSMSLRGAAPAPRLIVKETEEDLTDLAQSTSKRMVDKLGPIDGAILKRNSPSCGLQKVKIYGRNGSPHAGGIGFFAAELKRQNEFSPMIEEGRISDLVERDHFLVQLFTLHRFENIEKRTAALHRFHQDHKLLIMAHSVVAYKKLGQIAAHAQQKTIEASREEYRQLLFATLQITVTVKRLSNVFEHILGYFKNLVSAKERAQLVRHIENFRKGQESAGAVLVLFRHLSDLYDVEYIQGQFLFEPYPRALMTV